MYWISLLVLIAPCSSKVIALKFGVGFAVVSQRALAQIMCVDSRHRFILLCWIHLKGLIWSSAQRLDLCKSYLIQASLETQREQFSSTPAVPNLATWVCLCVRVMSQKTFCFVLFEDLNCPKAWHGSAMWLLSGQILHTDVVYLHHSGQQREANKLRHLMTKYRYPQRLARL